jgi:hypothetical protein
MCDIMGRYDETYFTVVANQYDHNVTRMPQMATGESLEWADCSNDLDYFKNVALEERQKVLNFSNKCIKHGSFQFNNTIASGKATGIYVSVRRCD